MTAMMQYRHFHQQLQHIYNQQEAGIITDWVFQKITGKQRSAIIKNPDEDVAETVSIKLASCLADLMQHKPVQYVLGEAWFYKMKLKVNEQVLIPRPETEELVQWIADDTKNTMPHSILDIGTGSGCIAIALKKKLPAADVIAIDVSVGALALANENAATQDTPIDFLQMDFLDEASWKALPLFDIIVSNPPYIPEAEKDLLDKNVSAYEPHTALFVPDADPLLFYKKIAAFGLSHLNSGGKIFMETHAQFAKQTAAYFSTCYPIVEIKKDLQERERMVMAVLL